MLPSAPKYGTQLAAVLPTVLTEIIAQNIKRAVVIVVDGCGWHNLRAHAGDLPNLTGLRAQKITTVAPSTTAAVLPTITTGTLPGVHGLLGYKILDPLADKLRNGLKDWDGLDPQSWLLAPTVFNKAQARGIASFIFGRSAHAKTGFTAGVFAGTTYVSAQTIADRFTALQEKMRQEDGIFYLYVDEFDKAAHREGPDSPEAVKWLRVLDYCVGQLLWGLNSDTAVIITADHGMIAMASAQQRVLEDLKVLPPDTRIGGEMRFRSFYLADPHRADHLVAELKRVLGGSCYVGARADWIASGVFGSEVSAAAAARLGDVLLVPKKRHGYLTATAPLEARMRGVHGGLDPAELEIPLLTQNFVLR